MQGIDKAQEIGRLNQADRVEVIEKPTLPSFVCVHSFEEDSRNGFHRFSFLLPLDQKESFLSHRSWDMRNDDFRPSVQYEEGVIDGKRERKAYYMQHGNESGTEALVRTRYYWGSYPAEIEVAEEFRLFWNLYYDRKRNFFLHCDVHGSEHEVVRIMGSRVDIQLKFLIDYLRAKQMHLALQLEGAYWSRSMLEDLGISPIERENAGEFFHWWFNVSNRALPDDYRSISVLTGKAIIPCPGPVKYDDPHESDDLTYPAFIIGQDANGDPVTDTWDEKSKGHANTLTHIFFNRRVLRKYFAEPERYKISDGELRCSGFWSLRMDNDQPHRVVVWLKDLALGLPRAEREHWRNHNIVPDGTFSKTFYTRNVRAWFANPAMPDLRLKQLYPRINKGWFERYGWPLWHEPKPEDQYVFRQLHVCLDENQTEFDHQNALLAKLVVDSLNVSEVTTALNEKNPSLARFEQFFNEAGFTDAKEKIDLLRIVQNLRSTGAVHTKGQRYAEALQRGSLAGLPLVDASLKIFQGAVTFIEWVGTAVLSIEGLEPETLP